MKKGIVIIGGGGHAKAVIDAIRSSRIYGLKGIVDPSLKMGCKVMGVGSLGSDNILDRMKACPKDTVLTIGVGSVRASKKRKELFERYADRFEFPPVIHDRAYVSKGSKIASGVQVMALAVVNPGASIQENSIINTAAVVEHDCIIGPHSHVSVGAILGGDVRVGECSHIGIGARVLQGVRIGDHVTVGAGAVVIEDVKDRSSVAGVPARRIDG